MTESRKRTRTKDRTIDRKLIALGVLGFLALAGAFFCLGIFYIGPMLRAQMESTQSTRSLSQQEPSSVPRRDSLFPTRPSAQPGLDVEITERSRDDTGEANDDERADSDDGITREGNQLTIRLDPRESRTPRPERPRPVPGEPEKPQTHREGIEPPRAATERRPAAPTQTDPSRIYRVQAGTYANKDNAEILAEDLRKNGFKPVIRSVQTADRVLHRVQLGGYNTREDAQELANDLTAHGYTPSVIQENRQE